MSLKRESNLMDGHCSVLPPKGNPVVTEGPEETPISQ